MLLETHEETIHDVTEEDIASVITRLTDPTKAYVVLSTASDSETYVQAAGAFHEGFLVERRDGCAGEHYRGDQRLTAGELVLMLIDYLGVAPTWSHAVTWHRVRVDHAAANANA